ncbi:MAG: TfoX/Sxy family protein [Limisphaerales bacterium]
MSALPDLRAKAMFGAHGIYSGDKFFGILDEGRLFFKTGRGFAGRITSNAAWGRSLTR